MTEQPRMLAKRGCVEIERDDSKYSSPVPIIGLYIVAASSLCFLAMLSDILSGLRHRRRWLPCRLFALNSVTLTLLSIASKIPVDLTTPMPSAEDQLSKLTGSTFICIAMGFLMPSLGINQNSECIRNMVALSILVVTVVVNIYIQIRTGLIFLFVIEHIIIMSCMLALLVVFWICVVVVICEKNLSLDHNKDLFTKGEGSMLLRLKLAYLYGFNYNPQFVLCRNVELNVVAGICILSTVVLIQAAFRYLALEFCGGTSDYGWSMWVVVVTQILTILLGSLATSFRLYAMSKCVKLDGSDDYVFAEARFVIVSNPILRMNSKDSCGMLLFFLTMLGLLVIHFIVLYPIEALRKVLETVIGLCFKHQLIDNEDMEEYKHLIQESDMRLQEWVLVKGVKDMKRCMEINKSESPNLLSQLLWKNLHMEQEDQALEVSSLSMVLLVRIAQVSIPSQLSGSLVEAYSEACEIIHFIEDRIKPMSFTNRKKSELARAVWMGDDFSSVLPQLLERSTHEETSPSLFELSIFSDEVRLCELDIALAIIKELKTALPSDFVWDEVGKIADFISNDHDYASIEDLYNYIELLFVNMLYTFLSQLPHALYKEVSESPAEEFDERVRRSLGILCKIETLEDQINWSFPDGCGISSLITTRSSTTRQIDREESLYYDVDSDLPPTGDGVTIQIDSE